MVTDTQLKEAKKAITDPTKQTDIKGRVYFTTGHTLLDLVVGGGEGLGYGMGYASGTILRDHGDSGSAKSFKAAELVAANYYKYKDKFKWRYVDVEHGSTLDTQFLYGFNMFPEIKNDFEVVTVEDWDYDLNAWLDTLHPENGDVGIYVLDSLDALSDEDTEERKEKRRKIIGKGGNFDEGTYSMNSQKFLSQEFFRALASKLEKKNAILFVISQERDNVGAGMYGKKNRQTGGRAKEFYETVRISSKVKQFIGAKDRPVSTLLEITGEKTRHPRPFRKTLLTIHFMAGVDSVADEVDFLFDLRTADRAELKKCSDSIVWEDGMPPMDRDSLIKWVRENKKKKELKERVIAKWEGIEKAIEVVIPNKYADD